MRAADKGKPAIILSAEDDRGDQESTCRAIEEGKIRNEQEQAARVEDPGFIFPEPPTMESPQETENKRYSLHKPILGPAPFTFQDTYPCIRSIFNLYFDKEAC